MPSCDWWLVIMCRPWLSVCTATTYKYIHSYTVIRTGFMTVYKEIRGTNVGLRLFKQKSHTRDMLSNFVSHSIAQCSFFAGEWDNEWENKFPVRAMYGYNFFENRNWCSIARAHEATVVFVAWNIVGSIVCWLQLIIHNYFVFVLVRCSNRSNESKWSTSQKCSHFVAFYIWTEIKIYSILWFGDFYLSSHQQTKRPGGYFHDF